MFDLEVQ